MPPPVLALEGALRRYEWGSRTAIPQLLGIEPDGRPAAELWFGAHPDDPSAVAGSGATLDALIDDDPMAALGPQVLDRFGPRLPFLLKILAAETALSIQVHPTLEQARAGFAREDAAGIARDAPNRTYRDANHKPELLCALTRFDALCGFRPVAATIALLDELALPELAFVAEHLRGRDPLRAAFTAVLTHPDAAPLVEAVRRRAAGAQDGPLYPVRLATEDFPGDVGAVLALLLNDVRLEPGEAIYLGAGNVHAYLRGTGVEIMANSDNVLRCGLTPKHVDVDELLRVTDFSELTDARWPRTGLGFEVPVADFRLAAFDAGTEHDYVLLAGAPRIVLCTAGTARVTAMADLPEGGAVIVPDADRIDLAPGSAAFVPASASVTLTGRGTVFVAEPGRSEPPG